MGCFSFLCKECDKGIMSNGHRGEKVRLYLLRDGKVIERLRGEYDSYGRVLGNEWKMEWGDICNMMFDHNKGNGIAAIHEKCWKARTPTIQSESDPHQGWGENEELFNNFQKDLEFD